ncbi:MAG: hypothetical protein GY866_14300 [Proteobacteria bacterium]|nr:hypothetical protein [Pseudomonadota bacterium]
MKKVVTTWVLILGLLSTASAQFVELDQAVTPSLSPTPISSTAAAAGWRDTHTLGFYYSVGDGETESNGRKTGNPEHWGRDLMAAFKWGWFAVEIGHSPGMTDNLAYFDEAFRQTVTTFGEIAHAAAVVMDSMSIGTTYTQQKYVNRYRLTVGDATFDVNEKKKLVGSGASLSLKISSSVYISGGLMDYEYRDEAAETAAVVSRSEKNLGLGMRVGESEENQFRLEWAKSILEEKRDTEVDLHLPAVETDSYTLEIKISEYAISMNLKRKDFVYSDLKGTTGIEWKTKEVRRRYGLIYLKQNGPIFGVYVWDWDKTDDVQSSSGSLNHDTDGKGFEIRMGYSF